MSDVVLMTFSGHRSAATLYRYLGWGAEHHLHRRQALAAATSLWPEPEGEPAARVPETTERRS
jgi:hypothetical protein